MLIYLIEWLDSILELGSWTRLFQYITFRAGIAIILSLIISMVFGGRIIKLLRSLQVGEEVRDLGLAGQKQKSGTPTMGGIIIVMAILVPCWLMARLDNIYVEVMLVATSWMTVICFIDDY
ncbi:MAG: phospho-N-acetylmuramoyl-pentapeptide-transferase, partial [Bacteroidota bacterium]